MKNQNFLGFGLKVLPLLVAFSFHVPVLCSASKSSIYFSSYPDSVRFLLSNSSNPDKLKLYHDLYDYFFGINQMDSAYFVAEEGYFAAVEKNDLSGQSDFLLNKAKIHRNRGVADSSIYYGLRSLELRHSNRHDEKELNAALYLMDQYSEIDLFQKATELGLEYLRKLKKCREAGIKIRFYTLLGVCSINLGQFQEGEAFFENASDLNRENNNLFLMDILKSRISVYRKRKDYKMAIQIQDEVIANSDRGNVKSYIDEMLLMGILHYESDDTAGTKQYFLKALELSEEVQYNPGKARSEMYLGLVYYKEQDYESALFNLKRAIDDYHEVRNRAEVPECLNKLAIIYSERGDNAMAIPYLRRYLKMADSLALWRQKEALLKSEYQWRIHLMEVEEIKYLKDISLLNQKILKLSVAIVSVLLIISVVVLFQIRLNKKKEHLFLRLKELIEASRSEAVPPSEMKLLHQSSIEPGPGEIFEPRVMIKGETAQQISVKLKYWVENRGFLERITFKDLANDIGTNTRYLADIIQQDYKVTNFNSFMNKLRIDYLLLELEKNPALKNIKVETIANQLGYASRTTFIKVFREMTGLNPNFYLDKLRKK